MTDEQRMDKFDEKLQAIDKRQESFESYMKMYIQKTDQQLQEMRADIKESKAKHEADLNAFKEKHDEDIKTIRAEIREDGKQTRRMLFANMAAWSLGLIAILIAIYLK